MGNKLDSGLKELMSIVRQAGHSILPHAHGHLQGLEQSGGLAIRAAAFHWRLNIRA